MENAMGTMLRSSRSLCRGFIRVFEVLREEKGINVAVFILKFLLYFRAVIDSFFHHCHDYQP